MPLAGLLVPQPPHLPLRLTWLLGAHVDQALPFVSGQQVEPSILHLPGGEAQSSPYLDPSPHTGGHPKGLREYPCPHPLGLGTPTLWAWGLQPA